MRDRLYRSRTDRMLFGVAGGMAEWLDVDPAVVRLVWALLILAGGVGLLLYIVAAIVVPEAPFGAASELSGAGATGAAAQGAAGTTGVGPEQARWEARQARRAARPGGGNGAVILGIVLVIAGVWFLVDRYIDIDTAFLAPGVLIVIGLVLVVGAVGRSRNPGG